MGVQDLRGVAMFDGLTDDQLGELVAAGEEVRFGAGDELFVEGRPAESWWVLLEGSVSLVRRVGHDETVLAVMGAPGPVGRWLPGLGRARGLPGHRPRRRARPDAAGAGGRAAGAWRMPGSRSACT